MKTRLIVEIEQDTRHVSILLPLVRELNEQLIFGIGAKSVTVTLADPLPVHDTMPQASGKIEPNWHKVVLP